MYSYKQGNSILTFLGIKHFTFFNLLLNDTILKHYVFFNNIFNRAIREETFLILCVFA